MKSTSGQGPRGGYADEAAILNQSQNDGFLFGACSVAKRVRCVAKRSGSKRDAETGKTVWAFARFLDVDVHLIQISAGCRTCVEEDRGALHRRE